MEFLRLASIIALGLLVVSGLVLCDGDKDSDKSDEDLPEADKCVNMDGILDILKDLEMDSPPQVMMDAGEKEKETPTQRRKRSIGYGAYQQFGGVQGFQGYGGYNGYNQYPYLGGSRQLPWLGGYNGYGYGGYGYRDYSYTNSRVQSFIQSFTPARYHVENNCARNDYYISQVFNGYRQMGDNCVVHNFYKRGTYTTAKTEFLALPFVRVVPVTTVKSIDYVGLINRGYTYTATLCNSCNRGYPQIELRCHMRPYSHVVRRFTFLPETARQQIQYGRAQDIALPGGIVNNGPVGMGMGP